MKVHQTAEGQRVYVSDTQELSKLVTDPEYLKDFVKHRFETVKSAVNIKKEQCTIEQEGFEDRLRKSLSNEYTPDYDKLEFMGCSQEEMELGYSSYLMPETLVDKTMEISQEISKNIKVPSNRMQMIRSAEGQNFQIQSVFDGKVEQAFYRRAKVNNQSYSMSRDRITLCVQCSYNAMVEAEEAKWIAVSIASVAKVLESVGIQVRVVSVSKTADDTQWYGTVLVKEYSERVNLNKILFLTSTMFFRRAFFGMIKICSLFEQNYISDGLGRSIEVQDGSDVVDTCFKDSSGIINIPQCFSERDVLNFIEQLNDMLA